MIFQEKILVIKSRDFKIYSRNVPKGLKYLHTEMLKVHTLIDISVISLDNNYIFIDFSKFC